MENRSPAIPLADRVELLRRFPEIPFRIRERAGAEGEIDAERLVAAIAAVYDEYLAARTFDLGGAVDDALACARPGVLDAHRIERRLDGAPRVNGLRGPIVRAILNLVTNAAEAQEGGGRIEVEAGIVGERAFVRVADRGPGMAADVAARAFERGFTTKGACEGCPGARGHGLADALAIAVEHGATLELSSEPGAGTTATLAFPAFRTAGWA